MYVATYIRILGFTNKFEFKKEVAKDYNKRKGKKYIHSYSQSQIASFHILTTWSLNWLVRTNVA